MKEGNGAERIAAERQRQIKEEGYDASHDSEHGTYALASAAAAYLLDYLGVQTAGDWWPWDGDMKFGKPDLRKLEIAGALIAAQIDSEIDGLLADANRGSE